MPISRGFTPDQYVAWADMLKGATGDIIGKAADTLHYDVMRALAEKDPERARKLNDYVHRVKTKGEEPSHQYLKRSIGQVVVLTPDMVTKSIQGTIDDPIIQELLGEADRVYSQAGDILSNLHGQRPTLGFQAIKGPKQRYTTGEQIK
jgi:hypothetical protein